MTIYQHIFKAWATLAGFDGESPTFADRELYANGVLIADWNRLYTIRPTDLRIADGYTEGVAKTYEELMTPENFSYGAFDWENEHGTRIGFTLGGIEVNLADTYAALNFTENGIVLYQEEGEIGNGGLGYGFNALGEKSITYVLNLGVNEPIELNYDEVIGTNIYAALYFNVPKNGYLYAIILNENMQIWVWDGSIWDTANSIESSFENTLAIYFDDGANLPEGVTWSETLASYFVPSVKTPTELNLVTSQANEALLGVQIATHASLWAMGIGCGVFIVALFKLIAKWFSRR